MAPEQHSGEELGRFPRARRTRTSPQTVGLTPGPGARRTPPRPLARFPEHPMPPSDGIHRQ
ncbi:hypothetical protein [Streptomyces incanus]|uniref:Uncharacterized protein n=1 Tax=Streptomyces incanus TaxID=887453 RepID=A0ABW0XJ86_9ACTN